MYQKVHDAVGPKVSAFWDGAVDVYNHEATQRFLFGDNDPNMVQATVPWYLDVSGIGRAGQLAKGGSKIAQTIKANVAASQKARQSSNYGEFLAKNFYLDSGYSYAKMVDHLEGINFNYPVSIINSMPKSKFVQFQLPRNPQGHYYAKISAEKSKLGIYTSGLQPRVYESVGSNKMLRSTTSNAKDWWSMKPENWVIETVGGEIQYFSPLTNKFKHIE